MSDIERLTSFLVANFPLLFIVVTMTLVLIFNKRLNKKRTILIASVLGIAFVLAILLGLEGYFYASKNVIGAVLTSYFGYILRPVCILLLIALIDDKPHRYPLVFIIPLILNAIYYMTALFIDVPALNHITFYFTVGEESLIFNRGYFNFLAHILSLIYLGYLVYVNMKTLKRKHLLDGIIVLAGAIAVIISVILESLSIGKNILNNTIAIYCVFYYTFLYVEETKRDPLTNLFDRRAYYRDLSKYDKQINGVAIVDMNGLKYLNDNLGHNEGDEGLITIARTLDKSFKENSHLIYRIGGDEFVVLLINTSPERLKELESNFLSTLEQTKYRASIGVAFKEKDEEYASLLKRAEEIMYAAKAKYYENGKHDRRKY